MEVIVVDCSKIVCYQTEKKDEGGGGEWEWEWKETIY